MQELDDLLADLQTVLADEREAVVRMDSAAVSAAAQTKHELAERLRKALAQVEGWPPRHRRAVHRVMVRLRAAAETNRALLSDATATLAAVRAVPAQTGTYDRRGAMRAVGGSW